MVERQQILLRSDDSAGCSSDRPTVQSQETTMPEISRVGVLGCGLMGGGIAQAAAAAGFPTVVRDLEPALLAGATAPFGSRSTSWCEKGKLEAAARDGALARLHLHHRPGRARGLRPDRVEAVTEDLTLKNELWRALDPALPAGHDLRLQHLEPLDRRHGGRHRPAGPVRRPAFLQPRAPHAAGRGGAGREHVARDVRARDGLRPARWARSRSRRATAQASW